MSVSLSEAAFSAAVERSKISSRALSNSSAGAGDFTVLLLPGDSHDIDV